MLLFLFIPVILFKSGLYIVNRYGIFIKFIKYFVPVLNFVCAAFLMVIAAYGFKIKILLLAAFLGLILGVLLRKYIKIIIVYQFLLAAIVTIFLINYLVHHAINPYKWMEQPDNIENVVFKKTPNIYFIQPDGYANFSELNKSCYKFDNSKFNNYLQKSKFKIYPNFRSNYYSTLSSNSSLFAMKHHYHNFPTSEVKELYNARDIIVGNNPVIKILKENDYRTHLLLNKSYLLINRPKISYDFSNINNNELSFFSNGFNVSRDIDIEFKSIFSKSKKSNNFYFLEQLSPSHITNIKSPGNIAEIERTKYLKRLEETNLWLKGIIDFILINDKNSLIIIAADHGGFVGMNSTYESRDLQSDRDIIYSIFTSQLAIKWPDTAPDYDDKIKTSVNLFRVLFSYLSQDESYLKHLEDDKSFIQIERGAPFGVYEYINEKGDIVFNQKELP
ncbi:hypothetical protein GCM10022397_25880 [Flavivirga jejuensis]